MPILNHRIYMMDIALPRDIDPNINTLDHVVVYDIDDLKKIHDENRTCIIAERKKIGSFFDTYGLISD